MMRIDGIRYDDCCAVIAIFAILLFIITVFRVRQGANRQVRETEARLTRLLRDAYRLHADFERTARARILELDGRVRKLEDLLAVADQKLMHLMDVAGATDTVSAMIKELRQIEQRLRTDFTTDIRALEKKLASSVKAEVSSAINPLKENLVSRLESQRKSDLIISESSNKSLPEQLELQLPEEQKPLFDHVNPASFCDTAHISPVRFLEERYKQIYDLAEQGFSPQEISEIVKIEIRAVSLILGMKPLEKKGKNGKEKSKRLIDEKQMEIGC